MEASKTPGDIRLFSQAHLIIASFLSGPIGGSVVMAGNYKSLGDEKRKREALMIGIGAYLFMMIVALNSRFFMLILPMVNLLAMDKWYKAAQGNTFASHVKNGGAARTWKALLVVCLISIIVSGALPFYINMSH